MIRKLNKFVTQFYNLSTVNGTVVIHTTSKGFIAFWIILSLVLLGIAIYFIRRYRLKATHIDDRRLINDVEFEDSSEDDEPSPFGKLRVSFTYNNYHNSFVVNVIDAQGLKSYAESIDSYVLLTWEPTSMGIKRRKTKTCFNTNNPVYDKSFKYNVSQTDLNHSVLIFRIFDKDIEGGKDLCLGKVVLSLNNLELNDGLEEVFTITEDNENDTGYGDICVVLKYSPYIGELHITVLELKDLNLRSYKRLPAVFIEVLIIYKKTVLKKCVTKTIQGTRDPYYMEMFVFHLKMGMSTMIQLKIKVMAKNIIGQSKCIGLCIIGCNSIAISGETHWKEMLSNHKKAVAYWHTIFSPKIKLKEKLSQ